jgi:hypothetical protein
MRYSALYQRLRPNLAHVWSRMMTLGPTPEFLLLGDDLHELPAEWRAQVVRRERIWPVAAPPDSETEESSKGK